MHQGALAFLVVVSSSHKSEEESHNELENFAISSRHSPLHGEGRALNRLEPMVSFFQSATILEPKGKDLSNDRYSVTTILDYYDRLNSDDARINILINSICGG